MAQIDVIQLAKDTEADIIHWRRDLHQIPELTLELPRTVQYVTQVLETSGIDYDASYVNGNAVVGLIKGTKSGPNKDRVLGLRADMDGLPVQEQTGLPFQSINQNMHACGHDGHTAMLLGAAKILQENRHLFSGSVKLLFQPGEEYPGGAKPMIEEKVLENPKVTRILGFHEGQIDPHTPKGKIGYKFGPMMASMDRFLIEVKGKGYHGAYPELSDDPVNAIGYLITAIQSIKSRNLRAIDPAVVSVTRVDGGFNQNVIPDNAEIEGTVRAFDDAIRQKICAKLEQIAKGVGETFGVECTVTYDYKYPPVINDNDVTAEVVGNLKEIFGDDVLTEVREPLMGGEDFAFFLQEVPGTFLFLSNPREIEGSFHGHHHPKFDIDETYLYMGTASFVQEALTYLE